jgi:hypothetical protein
LCAAAVLASAMVAVAGEVARAVSVGQGQGVTLFQNVYLDTQGLTTGTDGAAPPEVTTNFVTVNVNLSQLTGATSLSSGYLNVMVGSNHWAVQNLLVDPSLGSVSTSFQVPVPAGQDIPNLPIRMDYTPGPTPSYLPSEPEPLPYDVTKKRNQFCGLADIGYQQTALPQIPVFNGIFNTKVMQNVPNQQAADQQCVPAAFSNGLRFLTGTGKVAIPDAPNPGRFGRIGPANAVLRDSIPDPVFPLGQGNRNTPFVQEELPGVTLVSTLDRLMSRQNVTRQPFFLGGKDFNQGVAISQQLSGLTAYLDSTGNGKAVTVETQGVPAGTAFNANGVTVNLLNSVPTFQYILDALNAGAAVEGNYGFGGGGGHAVNIVGAGVTLGVPWLRYSSDWIQTGDRDPFDTVLEAAGVAPIHSSFVFPSYLANPTIGTDGLYLFGEADVAGNVPILGNITVMWVPEPGAMGMLVVPVVMMRRRR